MLVKSFVSNIIIDLSYNLKEYIQYKQVWKLFQVGCLNQHTAVALYRLDWKEKLLKIFTYPSNKRLFYRPVLNF